MLVPIWAIVPVKPFLRSKSRLAGVLSQRERAGLSREFLGHALDVLGRAPAVAQCIVVSRDPAALALARERRARAVAEDGALDLNAALGRATGVAAAAGAGAVLILPTDLPFLTVDAVAQLIGNGRGPEVVIAPDRHEIGTNALYIRPPGLLDYVFGPESFQRHLALARTAGAEVHVCRLPGVALDVDGPEDLQLYYAAKSGA
ncbi:MAG: 2-phospho-L-lactate guanylyltransferase [Anaerolineales bacterium]|nr:2-phospho-L-lactate guanylyltransferase [Anaerolineales bacterium]